MNSMMLTLSLVRCIALMNKGLRLNDVFVPRVTLGVRCIALMNKGLRLAEGGFHLETGGIMDRTRLEGFERCVEPR